MKKLYKPRLEGVNLFRPTNVLVSCAFKINVSLSVLNTDTPMSLNTSTFILILIIIGYIYHNHKILFAF